MDDVGTLVVKKPSKEARRRLRANEHHAMMSRLELTAQPSDAWIVVEEEGDPHC